MKKTILIFGAIAIAILLLFQVSKLSLLNSQNLNDVYLILSGVLFIGLGYVITRLFYGKRDTNQSKEIDQERLKQLKISKQEHKVLGLMSDGLSNMQIAEHLFISENTVKTHVSRILSKLNAKRRTEAVKIGRDLNII
ncbi:response regulator transcription factor [Winogradskyella sp.]|uniref:response regulator transcription factor n=1 Tax=Winogradskyella sp. TaxID=1883156 RepID=UPI003BA9F90E